MGIILGLDGDGMNLAQVDLNLLTALDALLRQRNVTRAGETVGLSQPAMSSTLARLRRLFGDELLVRVGREYHMTALAQELEAPLQEILRQIELTIERRPSFDPSVDEHTFTISASDYSTYLVLQPLLRRLAREAPNVAISILPLDGRAKPALESGETDLVILPAGVGPPDMAATELFTDRYVGVVSSDHPTVGDRVSLDEFISLPRLSYGRGVNAIEGTGDRTIHDPLLSRHLKLTLESFFLMPFLVVGTPFIALVHERLARRLAGAADMRIVDLEFETPPVSETMFWHPRQTSDPAHRWLRSLLVEVGRCI
jgi:DNA-binding transcriptional LysR family regulator